MAKHRSKDFQGQIKRAISLGCSVEVKNAKYRIYLPVGATLHPTLGTMYLGHEADAGVKPIKKFLDFFETSK
jgi:hypothetical protein